MDSDILEVKKKIPSGNQIIRNHWAVNRRNKQEWALLVRNQMRLRKVKKATADDKYTLLIISYRKRKLDKDNLYTGCKSLIDACVEEDLIFDDSPDYVDLKVEQYNAKEEHTMIIRKIIND
tara:strand:- start:2993 stop:3355 length:363 start_codon:yes stop_codon:yes gene_type:complete